MKTTIMLLWAMGLAWCRKGGGDIYQQTLISAPHSPPPTTSRTCRKGL